MGTANIKDFIEAHSEHKVEGNHDIRKLNAEKISGTDADYEKIKSIFLSMLKDIKKNMEKPEKDITSEELKKQIDSMKKQALTAKKKKSTFNESDMIQIVMNMLDNVDLDEYEKQKFQELTVHLLKRKR